MGKRETEPRAFIPHPGMGPWATPPAGAAPSGVTGKSLGHSWSQLKAWSTPGCGDIGHLSLQGWNFHPESKEEKKLKRFLCFQPTLSALPYPAGGFFPVPILCPPLHDRAWRVGTLGTGMGVETGAGMGTGTRMFSFPQLLQLAPFLNFPASLQEERGSGGRGPGF